MALKASLLIEARDKASDVFGRIAANAKKMGSSLAPTERTANRAANALARIGTKAAAPIQRADRFLTHFHRNLQKSGVYTEIARRAGARLGRGMKDLGKNILGAATQWASLAAIAAAGSGAWFFKGVIEAGSKFEQFQVILENTEGSAAKAKSAMNWVKDFASTTPYELEQVMQAFVALKSYGIDPTDGSLRSLGNAASGMGKDIMQAVEMMADAQTGEYERLKEFGIRASKQGNQVRFTYMKAGKEITKTAKNSGAEIQKSLIGIFDERFGGMMDRQSKTLAGTWSNIKDMFAGFQLDIANAGIFDLIKVKAEGVLKKLQGWAKDGTLKQWAIDVSARLERMVNWADKFISTGGWDRVAADIKTVADAAASVGGALQTAYSWLQKLDRAYEKIELTVDQHSPWSNVSQPAIKRLREIRQEEVINPGFKKLYQKPGKPIFVKGQAPRKTSAVDVGGQLNIKITTDKGVRATATKMASNDKRRHMNLGMVSQG
jgi:hypothetical protein